MPKPVSPELQPTSTMMSGARKNLNESFADTTANDVKEVEMSDYEK
jgi:hypothetical protein